MKHLLMSKALFTIVDKSEEQPAGTAENDVKAKYSKRAQRAFSTIALSVSSELVYLISDATSASDAWDKLAAHFERNTVANKLFLKKQYFRAVMRDKASISQHIRHMKELTDKLAAIQAPICEEDQVVTLLGSLPSSYDNVVMALEARVDDLTLEFVHQTLLNAEQKRADTSSSSDAAMYSKPKTAWQQQRRCHICSSPNHLKRDCPKNQDRKPGSGKPNHQHRAKQVTETCSTDNYDTADSFTVTDNCLTSVQGQPSNMPWIIDSGASRHMTMDQQVFCEYKQLATPEKVSVGDGRLLDAIGIGNVRVELTRNRRNQTRKQVVLKDVLYILDLAANLFSISAVTEKGFIVQFSSKRCWIKDSNRSVRAMGTLVGRMFHLDCIPVANVAAITVDIWHQRLGHLK